MALRIGINLHAFDDRISGVEYYGLGLLRALLGFRPENRYVVFTNMPALVRAQVPQLEQLEIVQAKLRTRPARILYEHVVLPRLAQRHALDVLHCVSYVAPLRRSRVPYVVTIHDTIALDHPDWCKRANALYYGLALARSARRAARVIAVSEQTAEDITRRLGLPHAQIRMIHPGIDEIFAPGGDPAIQQRVRARYGLPERYLLYVGNIEPKKNIAALLRVHRRLRRDGLSHKLVLAGARLWRARAALAALHREVADGHAIVTGYVDRADLPMLYQMADVFLFPSLYEGFGFPPLEAMACGTPVVSSCKGALQETVGRAAWIVDPCDDDKMTYAVLSLVLDRDVRARHVEAGLQCSRLFRWDKAAEATLAVYEEARDAAPVRMATT